MNANPNFKSILTNKKMKSKSKMDANPNFESILNGMCIKNECKS